MNFVSKEDRLSAQKNSPSNKKFRRDSNRTIYFSSIIDEASTSDLLLILDKLGAPNSRKNVYLALNTGGGDPQCALAVYDAVERLACPLVTIAEGLVASSGIVLFLAGRERYITSHSSIHIHRPGGSVKGRFFAEEFLMMAYDLERIEKVFIEIISERTGQKRERVKTDIKKTRIFNAEEAIEYGFAHKII